MGSDVGGQRSVGRFEIRAHLGEGGVVLWRAPGLPTSPTTGCVSTLTLEPATALAIGDHDGDGRNDIAISTAGVRVWSVTP